MRGPHDTLTSERLALRRFTPDDLELLVRLNSDPRVMEFTGGVVDRDKSQEQLDRWIAYYDANPALGVWCCSERATGDVVGIHLLNHIRGAEFIQVGYLLYPEYWGRGYATEMAMRLMRYGFVELGLPKIHAITDLPHVASQAVLLKVGLRRNGERRFPAYGEAPLAWFERDADSWLAEFGASA